MTYANSLPNSFHFDDIHGIVINPTVHHLAKYWQSYFTDPSTFTVAARQDWRPLVQITYALNYLAGGLNPALFRLFNLFLHVGTAFLIYLIVETIGHESALVRQRAEYSSPRSASDRLPSPHSSSASDIIVIQRWGKIALFGALLFAVHTANTEAVNYIWARSSLLVAFFYLLAFYCFLRGPLSEGKERNILWHVGGVAAYALGLATKATAITLPAILLLYELLFGNPSRQNPLTLFRNEPRRLLKYFPLAVLSIAYLSLRLILLPSTITRVIAPGQDLTYQAPGTYLLTQFRIWVYYLRLFFWPHPLLVDVYGFGWSHSIAEARVLLAIAVVVALLALAWLCRRSEPLITFFVSWYLITLLPEGSFIPLTNAIALFRAYLPYVGVSVVAIILSMKAAMWMSTKIKGDEKAESRRFWLNYSFASAAVLVVLIAATIEQNKTWRNEMTLWSYVLKHDPRNARAHMYIGVEHLETGNYREAERMFEKAVEINPTDYYAYVLRGYLNSVVNQHERALSDYNQAIKLDPRSPYNYFYRGELYTKMARYEAALSDYRFALALKPFYTDAHAGIARVYWLTGEFKKLAEACRKIIEIDAGDQRGYRCLEMLRTQKSQ